MMASESSKKPRDWENHLLTAFTILIASLIILVSITGVFIARDIIERNKLSQPPLSVTSTNSNSMSQVGAIANSSTTLAFVTSASSNSKIANSSTTGQFSTSYSMTNSSSSDSSSFTTIDSSTSCLHHHHNHKCQN
jgi:uncharacterized protein YneF (UPF0154 family)